MGGMIPMMGRQSTIESPDPVSLVTPPKITIENTSAQQDNNHFATSIRLDIFMSEDSIVESRINIIEHY